MAALTGGVSQQVAPNAGVKIINITVTGTAADTIDVSSAAATGGETLSTIYGAFVCNTNDGDAAEGAAFSGTTITIPTGPSSDELNILVWGN